MIVFYWLQLLGVAGGIVLLALSIAWHRSAMEMRSLDRFSEAWERLHRSRQFLFLALLFALLAAAAAFDAT